ncbi:MAG: carbohydrate-binding family 9-like protein [Cyclobacteriaceae bacterium]
MIIDGMLNEESWQLADWSQKFVDIEGNAKPKPLYDTRVKMLWDENYFYIAAKLEEPHIWATYTKRDAVIFHENDFEVFIDPDGDTHNYYELEINALGTVWDLMLLKPYRDGGPAIDAWDISGLKKGVWIDGTLNDSSDLDRGWTVELAIPWEILKEAARGTPEAGDQWRVNFSRVNWQTDKHYNKLIDPNTKKPFPEFNWVWSAQGVVAMHQPETWGYVQFSDKVVGNGVDIFSNSSSYYIQSFLRKIYVSQKKYRNLHGRYSQNFTDLNLGSTNKNINLNALDIQTTNSLFEASYRIDASTVWHIIQDGRIWKTIDTK